MRDRRAVILDRDGTVIVERHYLADPDQVALIPGVAGALRQLRQMGLRLVILTNQSGIGRGLFTEQRVEAIHQRMRALLAEEDVQLDGIFYCPHTPEDACACRKPAPGLIEQAARQLGFEPHESIVIGDKACDIELGRRVGAMTVLVRTGYGAEHESACGSVADYVADDLSAAVPVVQQLFANGSPAASAAVQLDLVVLCGGRGTRLGQLSATTPKPLLPVDGEPFLLRLLRRMKQQGCGHMVLGAHYLAEQFEAFARVHAREFPHLEVVVEPEPLGTGGALREAADSVRSSTFVAINGDSWLPQPLAPVCQEHVRSQRRFTAVVVRTSHVHGGAVDKGLWDLGPDGAVRGFATQGRATDGWVNAGCYVLDRAMVRSWPRGSYSLEANLPHLLKGERAGVFCSTAHLLDIGTPECYARAGQALEACP